MCLFVYFLRLLKSQSQRIEEDGNTQCFTDYKRLVRHKCVSSSGLMTLKQLSFRTFMSDRKGPGGDPWGRSGLEASEMSQAKCRSHSSKRRRHSGLPWSPFPRLHLLKFCLGSFHLTSQLPWVERLKFLQTDWSGLNMKDEKTWLKNHASKSVPRLKNQIVRAGDRK